MSKQEDLERSVVVVDRLPLFRHGIACALRSEGIAVAGETRSVDEGLVAVKAQLAEVVILGDASVTEALEMVQGTRNLSTSVLLLLGRASRDDLVALLEGGVAGMALRSVSPPELMKAVRALLAGERSIGSAFVPLLVGFADSRAAETGEPLLTSKETEVLSRLAEGMSNQQIASALYVTPATVKTHLSHIYAKLGANGRSEALTRALALGLLT